ncbi:MAG: hypothetical protein LBC51_05385 [Treponema sp.]|nr:hypothetical protein [Treponema sp.]
MKNGLLITSPARQVILSGLVLQVLWIGYQIMQGNRSGLIQGLAGAMGWSIYAYWSIGIRKVHILYESNARGFYIRTIKTCFYDPDFIAYEDIQTLDMLPKGLILTLHSGQTIRLKGLGKRQESVYQDIQAHRAAQESSGGESP